METFDPAVKDYTNYDMDEAATNTTILDIDINIICWRRKVNQVKEVFTTPEDWRRSAEKGSPFTRDFTGQLAGSALNSTEEANLLSNKFMLENETHCKHEIPLDREGSSQLYENIQKIVDLETDKPRNEITTANLC